MSLSTGTGYVRCAPSRSLRPWRLPRPPRRRRRATAAQAGGASNVWLVAGGGFATMRGDCQTCEEDFPYRQSGAVLVNIGYRVNSRMDVGAEVYWMPVDTAQGTIRATHFDAVAQFRPWASQGFFVKGGAGMAFVRNWVDVLGSDSFNEKALSVVVGAGWAFRLRRASACRCSARNTRSPWATCRPARG